ncbi:MAG: hypothetical protein H7067_11295 [Burkholderiales bacterium]|nr:hypothetical protein [Opitutaceae bacterium]
MRLFAPALLLTSLLPVFACAQADLPGPDGRAYPDFRRAGALPGPAPKLVVPVSTHGGKPDDAQDDSAAFRAAIAAAAASPKGGIVLLEPGVYQLGEPLCITADRLWIRGAGKDRTTIEFTYGLNPGEIRFVGLSEGQRVTLDTSIEVHAYPGPGDSSYPEKAPPGQLKLLTLSSGGKVVTSRKQDEGGPFNLSIPLWRFTTAAGSLPLVARVEWTDGKSSETTLTLDVEATYLPDRARRLAQHEAAFTFIGDQWTHRSWYRWRLAEDASRGATRLRLTRAESIKRAADLAFIDQVNLPPPAHEVLRVGDSVALSAFATPEWKKATGNVPDFARINFARIAAIEGDTLVLDRPLRIDFPVAENSRLDARFPIRGCVVEGFTLRQTRQLWTHGILFQFAEDCLVRDVRVVKAGRNPVAIESSLQCEIRESEFDDGWYQVGGGTSYLGLGTSFDCLIQDVRTTRLRHAPVVNWSAAGNVFSRSTFQRSDANWHSGWCHENLVEDCVIDASTGSGSYGYGIYTSKPQSGHGATGPRNVFWGNLITSPQSGVLLGGAIDGTVIAYNRFIVRSGPGIDALATTTNTRVVGNHFVLAGPTQPLFKNHRSGTGWEVVDNRVFGGNGNLTIASSAPLAADKGNTFAPVNEGASTPRPVPPAPSLRDWQLKHHPLPRE